MNEEDVAHLQFRQNGSTYLVIMPCPPDPYSTLAIQACHSVKYQIFNLRMEKFGPRGRRPMEWFFSQNLKQDRMEMKLSGGFH